MIKSILPDVDQGLYCYDTGLTFGLDVGLEILKQVDIDDNDNDEDLDDYLEKILEI
jgi:hypothetical protein